MPDWNTFLIAQGANADAQGNVDFAHTNFDPDATYLIALQQQGVLSIQGPDAVKFLQGQVTCDVRELANNQTRLGAQCNIKGRMLLCFRALQPQNEQLLLRFHKNLIANGLSSFGKYIVFSKAKLTDATKNYRYIGIAGPKAHEIVTKVFGVIPNANDEWQSSNGNLIIRINENRFECWLNPDEAEAIWKQIATYTTKAGESLWSLLNIQAGLGDISLDTFETFTPQAINFQLVNGINFRKGCYTGQEIVARLHYRGTLKRHMYRFEFTLQNNLLPAEGSELKNAAGKSIGEVVLAAQKSETRGELLASVVDDERADIYLANNPQKLELLPLPYAIPTPNEVD